MGFRSCWYCSMDTSWLLEPHCPELLAMLQVTALPQQVKDLQREGLSLPCAFCAGRVNRKSPAFPARTAWADFMSTTNCTEGRKLKLPAWVAVATALQRFLCYPCRAGWRVQALEGDLWLQEKISATAAESQESPGYWGSRGETTAPKIRAWGDLLALPAVCQLH